MNLPAIHSFPAVRAQTLGTEKLTLKRARAQAEAATLAKQAETISAKSALLWTRCRRAAERAGLEQSGELIEGAFQPAAEVTLAAAKLRAIAFEARRLGSSEALAVERVAVTLSHVALTHARTLERSDELERLWRLRQESEAPACPSEPVPQSPEPPPEPLPESASEQLPEQSGTQPRAQRAQAGSMSAVVAEQVERAHRMSTRFKAIATPAAEPSPPLPVLPPPPTPSSPSDLRRARPLTGGSGKLAQLHSRASAAKAAQHAGRTTYWNALGGLMIEPKVIATDCH